MNLKLVWYKYLTSTGILDQMTPAEFGKFARKNLPYQPYIHPIFQKYFKLNQHISYSIDDYMILAKL